MPYPRAIISTDQGDMTVELWDDVAPKHVENFLKLGSTGFYNNLIFHRIIPGFVIQGGCPQGSGTGGPGWQVKAEFNDRKHVPGTLSMARSNHPDSAGSQFFICLTREKCQHLDKQYTGFGQVVEGLDVVKKLGAIKTGAGDRPITPPKLISVKAICAGGVKRWRLRVGLKIAAMGRSGMKREELPLDFSGLGVC